MKRRSASVLVVSMTWLTTASVEIEDGEVGVSKSFGAIRECDLRRQRGEHVDLQVSGRKIAASRMASSIKSWSSLPRQVRRAAIDLARSESRR